MADLLDLAMAAKLGGGSGGGTSNYSDLSNKPQINGTTLVGNKSGSALGLANYWEGTQAEYAQAAATIPAGTLVRITDDTDIDTTPTQGSSNPVTSGGVFNSLARLDTSTGDIYFGQARVGRKMSQADYDALATKDSIYYLTYQASQNSGRSLETPPATKNESSENVEDREVKEPETKKNVEVEISDEQLEKLPPFGFGGYDE